MNRPRDSLLELFDPLKTPAPDSTRARNVTTPDSDKENSSPPRSTSNNAKELTMTAFFSRTYTKRKQAPPAKPRRRLVDIGDVTVDDVTVIERGRKEVCLDEDRGEDSLDENEIAHSEPTTPMPPSPRTPLADIALEPNPVNVARRKVYRREDLYRPTLPTIADTPAPINSPLAGVINSINFPHMSSDDRAAITPETESKTTPPTSAPAEPSSTAHLASSSTPSLLTNITITVSPSESNANESQILSRGLLGQNSATTSFDLHGSSFDLQSLFKAQEGSFNLLNDRMDVDVDMGGLESFLGAMDFDAPPRDDKASVNEAADEPSTSSDPLNTTPAAKPRLSSEHRFQQDDSERTIKAPKQFWRANIKDEPSGTAGAPLSAMDRHTLPSSSLALPSSSHDSIPIHKSRRASGTSINPKQPETSMASNLPKSFIPSVPALRIVKRKGHERAGSTTSTTSSSSMGNEGTSTSHGSRPSTWTETDVTAPPRRAATTSKIAQKTTSSKAKALSRMAPPQRYMPSTRTFSESSLPEPKCISNERQIPVATKASRMVAPSTAAASNTNRFGGHGHIGGGVSTGTGRVGVTGIPKVGCGGGGSGIPSLRPPSKYAVAPVSSASRLPAMVSTTKTGSGLQVGGGRVVSGRR